jgi:hypothetical protein
MRGASNVVQRCLRVAPGESVHLFTYRAEAMYERMARAVTDAGGVAVRVDLEALNADLLTSPAAVAARLEPRLAGATATMLLAPDRPSAALSMGIALLAERLKVRHLHLLGVDERVLEQSARAEPDLLETVNGRIIAALELPCQIHVTSEAGTDLEVRLAHPHPLVSSNGRPEPGGSENLPAGLVFTHPVRVTGTLVVDRALFGPGITLDPAGAEAHARGRVGMIVLPTNYLVRSEVGIDRQDMLLPCMNLSLGFANQAVTKASYEAPVQMVLLGKRQTVEVGTRKLVENGRLEDALVEGIDPFR